MSFFLFPDTLNTGATVTLSGAEAAHLLRSRRIRPGERFALQDSAGGRFTVELLEGGRGSATLHVLEPLAVPPLPRQRVTLLQAAVKEKAAELIVQKSTELVVAEIHLFPSANSDPSPRKLGSPRSAARWEKIAWEACKQSGRGSPPPIILHPGLEPVLAQAAQARQSGGG